MSVFAHSVRAWLRGAWHEQGCRDQTEACALFDRIRAINPTLEVERLVNGAPIEVAGRLSVAARNTGVDAAAA